MVEAHRLLKTHCRAVTKCHKVCFFLEKKNSISQKTFLEKNVEKKMFTLKKVEKKKVQC